MKFKRGGNQTYRLESEDGVWIIEITEVPVNYPDYLENWGYGAFLKTVSCNYFSGEGAEIRMQARFSGSVSESGGAYLGMPSNGAFSSSSYSATGSASYSVIRSHSTSSQPAKALYSQVCRENASMMYCTFQMSLSLTHTGSATIQITRS